MGTHFIRASSLLVVLFVLLLFLFPVASGPYSALHGPATAMRAVRAARCLFWLIATCGGGLLPLIYVAVALQNFANSSALFFYYSPHPRLPIRC